MLKTILRRLRTGIGDGQGARTVYVPPPAQSHDTEIPRYPPFQEGLPATDPRRLLAPQWEFVRSIQHTLALECAEFERLVLPVIERYAAFVHLLPASERHHHRLAGGLLRHGLEVASWAARAAEGVVFAGGGTPLERKSLEPRWRMAVCFAGLLHDIGKAAADVSVTNNDGTLRWNPNHGALYDWARAQKVARYFLHWRSNHQGRHQNFSVFFAHHILTKDPFDWLSEPGPVIVQAVFEAIGGTAAPEDRFARLVNAADSESTQRDLKSPQYGDGHDNPLGVPVDRYLLDAMRRLLTSGEWCVNQRGARVWSTNHGLFVVWKHACEDIHRLLARDGLQGIPRDAATLAEVLLDREHAVHYVNRHGEKYPTWPVAPQLLDAPDGQRVVLRMLKLSDPHLLFSSEPPPMVMAHIDDISLTPAFGETQCSLITEETTSEHATYAEAPGTEDNSRIVILSDAQQSPEITAVENTNPFEHPPERARLRIKHTEPPSASPRDMEPEQARPPQSSISDDVTASDERVTRLRESTANVLQGRAGEILTAMARDIAAGKRAWGDALALVSNEVIIRYPDAIAAYGNPAEILNALSEAEFIALDPMAPVKKVREREGVRGLVLAQKPAAAVIALAHVSTTRTPNAPPPEDARDAESARLPYAPSLNDQPAGCQQRNATIEEAASHAKVLVQFVRARDPQITGDVSEDGGWLRVPRSVLSSFLDAHGNATSLAQLRKAIEQRHDVRLDVDHLANRQLPVVERLETPPHRRTGHQCHTSLNCARSASRARASRDLTVPTAIPSEKPISS